MNDYIVGKKVSHLLRYNYFQCLLFPTYYRSQKSFPSSLQLNEFNKVIHIGNSTTHQKAEYATTQALSTESLDKGRRHSQQGYNKCKIYVKIKFYLENTSRVQNEKNCCYKLSKSSQSENQIGVTISKLKQVKVSQSYPTLFDLMDYTVHEIFQARILEWVAFPFFRGSSQPRDQTQVSCIAGRLFTS